METYAPEIKKVLKIAGVVAIILGLFLTVEALKSFKEYRLLGSDTPAVHTITVAGTGEAFAKPNIVEFTFSIVEEANTVELAQSQVTEKEVQAIATLKESGVNEEDIRTVSYDVYPLYEYRRQTAGVVMNPESERVLVGYEVRQTMQVKSEDTEVAGELIQSLGRVGVQNMSGLTFVVEDEDGVQSEARKSAIDDARRKAEELADQLGVKLVRVVSFNQGGGDFISPMRATAEFGMSGASDSVANPQIPTGENRFVENVMITYEIR